MKKSVENSEHYTWGDHCDGWHLLRSEKLSIIQEKMPSGTSELIHCHRFSQQMFYILSGTAVFYVNGVEQEVSKQESIHISPGVLHAICNRSEEDLDFLLVSEPPAQGDRIDIVSYNEALKTHIRDLNVEWLKKYFRVEAHDEMQLGDPQNAIINKGGYIYYVRYKGEIVGTASLIKVTDNCFELAKMAVTEHAKGLGIGNILMQYCIQEAYFKQISSLILYSNTSLAPAIHLYKKYGFQEIPLEHTEYERADIMMEKIL